MHNFILKTRPLSYNSCKGLKKANYKTVIESSLIEYNDLLAPMDGELYAIIYYFYNKALDLDTDNLSKPVWDCLGGLLFKDDQQIKIRIAGSFDLTKGDYNVIDFSGLQGEFIIDLLDAFNNEDHIVYVECGKFKPTLYKFNIE